MRGVGVESSLGCAAHGAGVREPEACWRVAWTRRHHAGNPPFQRWRDMWAGEQRAPWSRDPWLSLPPGFSGGHELLGANV